MTSNSDQADLLTRVPGESPENSLKCGNDVNWNPHKEFLKFLLDDQDGSKTQGKVPITPRAVSQKRWKHRMDMVVIVDPLEESHQELAMDLKDNHFGEGSQIDDSSHNNGDPQRKRPKSDSPVSKNTQNSNGTAVALELEPVFLSSNSKCKEKSLSKKHVKNHPHTPTTKPLICKGYGTSFSDHTLLHRHTTIHKNMRWKVTQTNGPKDEGKDANLQCPQCTFGTDCPDTFVHHAITHGKEKLYYPCQKCPFVAMNENDLRKHMLYEHCMSDAQYLAKQELKEQTSVCNLPPLFSCKKCCFQTRNKNIIGNHLEIVHKQVAVEELKEDIHFTQRSESSEKAVQVSSEMCVEIKKEVSSEMCVEIKKEVSSEMCVDIKKEVSSEMCVDIKKEVSSEMCVDIKKEVSSEMCVNIKKEEDVMDYPIVHPTTEYCEDKDQFNSDSQFSQRHSFTAKGSPHASSGPSEQEHHLEAAVCGIVVKIEADSDVETDFMISPYWPAQSKSGFRGRTQRVTSSEGVPRRKRRKRTKEDEFPAQQKTTQKKRRKKTKEDKFPAQQKKTQKKRRKRTKEDEFPAQQKKTQKKRRNRTKADEFPAQRKTTQKKRRKQRKKVEPQVQRKTVQNKKRVQRKKVKKAEENVQTELVSEVICPLCQAWFVSMCGVGSHVRSHLKRLGEPSSENESALKALKAFMEERRFLKRK